MNQTLARLRCSLAAAVFASMFATTAFAVDALPEEQDDDTAAYEADGPLFDAAPVAYDAAQPAEGMESMGMGGMAAPAPAARTPTSRRVGPTGSRQTNIRLASVPNMFGDFSMATGQIQTRVPDGQNNFSGAAFDIPSAGGSRRVKIGDNNVSLPVDRVFVMYNHFHNALQVEDQPLIPGPITQRQLHIDRYTVGFEKTFFDGLWSVDVRMPFNSDVDYQVTTFGVTGGNVGNVAIILKNLLYIDESTAVAAGVGFDAPTGSDVDVRLGQVLLNVQNDAFHILPWVGFANNMNDTWYVTGFAQLDFATTGNEVIALQQMNRSLGSYNEQNLAYIDFSLGRFLYKDPTARYLTSITTQAELHYTTTIQDSDQVGGQIGLTQFDFSNPYNRQDITNGTIALQFEIANKSFFRVAAVAPLSDDDDKRVFDAEIQAQYNRRF